MSGGKKENHKWVIKTTLSSPTVQQTASTPPAANLQQTATSERQQPVFSPRTAVTSVQQHSMFTPRTAATPERQQPVFRPSTAVTSVQQHSVFTPRTAETSVGKQPVSTPPARVTSLVRLHASSFSSPESSKSSGESSSRLSPQTVQRMPASAPPCYQRTWVPVKEQSRMKVPPPPKSPSTEYPLPDNPLTSGTFKIGYYVLEDGINFPPIPSARSPIAYYQGLVQYDHEIEPRKASFISFDTKDIADSVFYCGEKVDDLGVLKPILCVFDRKINKGLVGFKKFRGLLSDCNRQYLEWLLLPSPTNVVPRIPTDGVIDFIQTIFRALKAMRKARVGCSFLDMLCAYFWAGDDVKVLANDCSKYYDTEEQWLSAEKSMLFSFEKCLRMVFLVSDVDWPERDTFFYAFHKTIRVETNRLSMLQAHPFLIILVKAVYKIFQDVDHALQDHVYDREGMEDLCAMIRGNDFDEYIMRVDSNGVESWDRPDMYSTFRMVFEYGSGFSHLTSCGESYFRFKRNIYDHHYFPEYTISFKTMVVQFEKEWPLVPYHVHVNLY